MKPIIKLLIKGIGRPEYIFATGHSQCLVGTGNCDLVVTDRNTARYHAFLYETNEGKLAVRDLKLSGGTFVNGIPVRDQVLEIGDVITVGHTTIQVREFRPSTTSAPAGVSYRAEGIWKKKTKTPQVTISSLIAANSSRRG